MFWPGDRPPLAAPVAAEPVTDRVDSHVIGERADTRIKYGHPPASATVDLEAPSVAAQIAERDRFMILIVAVGHGRPYSPASKNQNPRQWQRSAGVKKRQDDRLAQTVERECVYS